MGNDVSQEDPLQDSWRSRRARHADRAVEEKVGLSPYIQVPTLRRMAPDETGA